MTEIIIHADGSVTLPAADRETLTRALAWSGVLARHRAADSAEMAERRQDHPDRAERHQRDQDHYTELAAAIRDLDLRINRAAARASLDAAHRNRP